MSSLKFLARLLIPLMHKKKDPETANVKKFSDSSFRKRKLFRESKYSCTIRLSRNYRVPEYKKAFVNKVPNSLCCGHYLVRQGGALKAFILS